MEDEKIYVESDTTKKLDDALATKQSLILCGPTGVGKTAIVKSWLYHYKDKVNSTYIDGSTLPKCFGKLRYKNGLTLIGQEFSNKEIDTMAATPNLVVVMDNYHLLSKEQRHHVLFLCDGYVVDEREQNGFKRLDNIEFLCCIKTTKY